MTRINKSLRTSKQIKSRIPARRSPPGYDLDPTDVDSPFIETKKFGGITYEKAYTCFSREKAETRKIELKEDGYSVRITEVPTGQHPIFSVWKA